MPIATVPPECQALADEVGALGRRAEVLAGEAAGAVGLDAWKKLAELAALRQDLERKRAALNTCVRAHAGGLPCELVIMDAGGGPTAGDRVAHLWDLSTATPTLKETVSVQGAGFSLAQPVTGDTLAITVTTAQAGPGRGADFRSGVVAVPAGTDPRLRLEVVLGRTVTVTDDEISRWFSSLTIPPFSFDAAGLGTVRVVISSVAGRLAASMIQVRVAGTVAAPAVTAQESPFSAGAGLGIVPSTSPVDPQPAEATIVGRPTVELAGPLAVFAGPLNLALSTGIFNPFLAQVGPILDSGMHAVVARAFALVQLPSATLSIREIAIEPSAITFQPALGVVGTGLSTFRPDRQLLLPNST